MISEGQIVEGKVTVITKYGAFVKVETGEVGMVHISEIVEEYVKDIKDYLVEGQTVCCKSLGSGKDGKLSLSIKRAKTDSDKNEKRGNQSSRFNQGRTGRGRTDFKPAVKADVEVSFEDRLSKFMKDSDERLLDLKKKTDNKKGGGYSRRS